MKLVADLSLCGRPWGPRRRITPAALFLDFVAGRYAPGGFPDLVSFTRASAATYFDASGTMQTAAIDAPRIGRRVWDGSAWVNKGILGESESRTNSIRGSRDLGGLDWRVNCTATQDAVGIDGVANSAWTLGDTDPGSYEHVYQDLVVPNDTSTHVASVFIKKASQSTDNAPTLRVDYGTGAGKIVSEVAINASTGVIVNASGPGAGLEFVEDWGGWWRLVVPMQNDGNGNTAARMALYPAAYNESGSGAATNNGSAILDQAQFEINASLPSSPIVAAVGTTVTRAADSLIIPAAKLPYSATAMSWARDLLITYADTDSEQTLFDWRVDASNRITLTLDTSSTKTGALTLSVVKDGVSVSISTSAELTPGVDVAAKIAWRVTASEINIALDGAAETAVTNTAGVPDLSSAGATLGGMVTVTMERGWTVDLGDTGIAEATS